MNEKNTTLTEAVAEKLDELESAADRLGFVGFRNRVKELRALLSAAQPKEAPASNAQDAVDARRYRELRDCNSRSLVIVEITGIGEDDWHVLTEDDADKAIDAALSAKESEHG